MTKIRRTSATVNAIIASGSSLSGAIQFSPMAMLIVRTSASWTDASIGFKVSATETGTYLPLYDDDGDLVQIDSASANLAYTAPAALASAFWIKLWSQNGSAINTDQGAERILGIDMKA